METRSHSVLVNAAGFLYASLGFSLSVLAALFSIFQRPNRPIKVPSPASLLPTKPKLPSTARGRRIVRSVSDQSIKSSKPTPLPEKSREPSSEKRIISSSHRRSRSLIPIIKIDHFDNIEPRVSGPINHLPKPYYFTISPDDPAPSSESRTSSMGVGVGGHDRSAFRLFSLKSWGKDWPKVGRHSSSGQLDQPPLVHPTEFPVSHKKSNSDGNLKICSRSRVESEPKTRKTVRKATSSRNVREKVNVQIDVPPPVPRGVEKKRSQTLRTQPYEAPYFCTPPVPMPFRKSPSRSNLRSPPPPPPLPPSLTRKSSKSLIPNS